MPVSLITEVCICVYNSAIICPSNNCCMYSALSKMKVVSSMYVI